MTVPSLIEIRSDVMLGKPCLRGTRIPVYLVLEKLGAGESVEEIVASYGHITREHVLAAIQYGAGLVRLGLGSRIAARFARTGLSGEIPEWREEFVGPIEGQ